VRLHRAKARLAKELALSEAVELLPAKRVAVEEAP
jgi:hypothetical protein